MTLFEGISMFGEGVIVIGFVFIGEGFILLSLTMESWEKTCTFINKISVGQVHTIAFILIVLGVISLIFGRS